MGIGAGLEMIRLFSKRLPRDLSRDLYREYQRLYPRLTQIMNEHPSHLSEDDREFVYLLLAMSIFYDSVVMPLAGAASFANSLLAWNVSNIQIGDYNLTEGEKDNMRLVVREYHGMMKSFGISKSLFAFHDTRTFLDNALHYLRGGPDEQ